MTLNQILFIALIPLLSIPLIIGMMKLYQALISKSIGKMDRLSVNLHRMTRKLHERSIDQTQRTEIEVDFVPESFFENISTDKTRPRKELLGMSMAFLIVTYFHFTPILPITRHDLLIYTIYLCLAFLMLKAVSFTNDIKDIDRFITRELVNKYADRKYSFLNWSQLGARFNYINITLLLIFIAVRFSTYLYITKTRVMVFMILFFAFSITRLLKFRDYINQMYALYEVILQSYKRAALNMTGYYNITRNILEAISFGLAIAFAIYLLSLETLFIRLLMYIISFGSIYFIGKALYHSRNLFFKVLIDIDNIRKPTM